MHPNGAKMALGWPSGCNWFFQHARANRLVELMSDIMLPVWKWGGAVEAEQACRLVLPVVLGKGGWGGGAGRGVA